MGDSRKDGTGDCLEQDFSVSRILEEKGVSRRDFMKFCSTISAALALPVSFTPRIAQALDEVKRTAIFSHGSALTDALTLLYHQWNASGAVTPLSGPRSKVFSGFRAR